MTVRTRVLADLSRVYSLCVVPGLGGGAPTCVAGSEVEDALPNVLVVLMEEVPALRLALFGGVSLTAPYTTPSGLYRKPIVNRSAGRAAPDRSSRYPRRWAVGVFCSASRPGASLSLATGGRSGSVASLAPRLRLADRS
jgi:hypothetical protein